ncbi:YbjQ family protein [Desulfospira joergensenii]|uniref:YbjQ family protein n=1 Tax=Desulfospira joergensenii TaxID=53329 RepID=UPI0003B6FC89|nr:heavy metal-binding domain-containing protein [Desulfospira joergensenii]
MEQLIIFVVLLFLGYSFGRYAEKRHYRSILEREELLLTLPTTSRKKIGDDCRKVGQCELVNGSMVVSVDYFKRILAKLRNFFGGNVQSYETLVDRARREAVLRMKESCPDADMIINLRLETSSITKGKKNQVGSVEVLAYGTAIYFLD